MFFNYIARKLSSSPASKIPVFRRLYFVLYQIFKPRKPVVKYYDVSLYLDPDSRTITPDFLINGSYEEFETELFISSIKPGMVVVDVGANIGAYSLIAASVVGETGIVYAFEPSPKNFQLLVKNIEMNGFRNVIAINKAVSDRKGTSTLYIGSDNSGGPSLSRHNGRFDHHIETDTIDLDSYFAECVKSIKVDIIKTDTEGAEGLVLAGAKNILLGNDLKLFMELWPYGLYTMGTAPDKLINSLTASGYKIKLIDARNRCINENYDFTSCLSNYRPENLHNLLIER